MNSKSLLFLFLPLVANSLFVRVIPRYKILWVNKRNFGIKKITQLFCYNNFGVSGNSTLMLQTIFQVGKMSGENGLNTGSMQKVISKPENKFHVIFMPLLVPNKPTITKLTMTNVIGNTTG